MIRRPMSALLVLLLVGCAAEKPPLRIGALVWPPYELAYLARDRGYLDTDRIEMVDYQTPAEVTRAYRYGLIDAYFLTTQFALPGVNHLPNSRIAYVIDFSIGGDALLARPGIERLSDLQNRRIGVEASPLGGYMLQRALDFAGLRRDEVILQYVDTPDQVGAYTSGAVDAVITYEPYRSRVLNWGATELFSSSRIPGEIIDVLIVPDAVMNDREADLRQFVHGIEEARRFYIEHPGKALAVMAERQKLSPATLNKALDGIRLISLEENRSLLSGHDPTLLSLLDRQAENMHRAGLIAEPPDLDGLIDSRLVEEKDH